MTTTPETDNIETVRRLFDAFYAADDGRLLELLDDEFVTHGPGGGSGDGAGWRSMAQQFDTAIDKNTVSIDDVFAASDRVVVRYTSTGILSGELFGVAPTGQPLTTSGIEIYRLSNGRIREVWGQYDMSALFESAG